MRLSDEMFLIFVDGSAVVVYLGAFWPAVVSVFDVLTAGYTKSCVSDALPGRCDCMVCGTSTACYLVCS